MGFFLPVIELFALYLFSDGGILPQYSVLTIQLFASFLAQLFLGNELRHRITSFHSVVLSGSFLGGEKKILNLSIEDYWWSQQDSNL